ncbi:hypothetical protein HK104_008218 [Borealophlyctis nickersoniae]|nr:hypothetical protein HK104_008218 [Borealophlyctis nickersoniae]
MSTPLPTDSAELQELVRQQAQTIKALTEEKNQLLSNVEKNEKSLKEALQIHLDHAQNEKTQLENSMQAFSRDQQARSEVFEKQIKDLRIGSMESVYPDPILVAYPKIMESDNLADIKGLATKMKDEIEAQQALIKKLKFELEMELGHINIMRADNQALRQLTVNLQASAEQEEEYISNRLLKRINELKKEKGELLLKVEMEEEQITNTLQKKLAQLQKEKIDMEIALEQEQEFIVNRLQKQLESLRQQQMSPAQLASTPNKMWHPTHSPSSSMVDFALSPGVSPGVVEMLRAEVNALKSKLHEMEREYEDGATTCGELYQKLREEASAYRAQLGLTLEDFEKQYPVVLPVVSLSSPPGTLSRNDRSRSTGPLPVRRSTSDSMDGAGLTVAESPKEGGGIWGRSADRKSSRSVSSTRGSIMSNS